MHSAGAGYEIICSIAQYSTEQVPYCSKHRRCCELEAYLSPQNYEAEDMITQCLLLELHMVYDFCLSVTQAFQFFQSNRDEHLKICFLLQSYLSREFVKRDLNRTAKRTTVSPFYYFLPKFHPPHSIMFHRFPMQPRTNPGDTFYSMQTFPVL